MGAERAKTVGIGPAEVVGPADVASWQSRLRAVVLETITEGEVRDVLRAVLEKAKCGDLAAARMVLAYGVGNPARGEAPEPGPARARPGTRQKLDALAYRAANGLPLHHPRDARFGDDDR